ncbi:MAG: hypothetical protein JXB39_05270 [Deltaproteobacteria bacterium]|nr:hypothetical protein [Deltaproteobacteria bacterium]
MDPPRSSAATLLAALVAASALGWPVPSAQAYESDQWTDRDQPLADALPASNARADEMLAVALDQANRRTQCEGTDEEMRHQLAREIDRIFGDPARVPARGKLPPMVMGAYAAWLESGPIDRRTFSERQDIYSRVRLHENMLLKVFGPASTIRFGDTLLGTDKIDHFLVQGYLYFRRSRGGNHTERAVRWGTRTEWKVWGVRSTDVFSFGDLAANFDGYLFYATLLEEGSLVRRREDGCVEQVRPWDWAEWVDWRYDEVLDPSWYAPPVDEVLRQYLVAHADEICPQWHELDLANDRDRWRRLWEEVPPWFVHPVPSREDPFDLSGLCGPPP